MKSKLNHTTNDKKEDGIFKKKNIKHNRVEESSRAKFSSRGEEHLD